MSDPTATLTIENVVASTSIDQELDLASLAADLGGADYDPDRFPGLVYRTTDPKATTLIFRSGKIVTTGASSVEDVDRGIETVFAALDELGIPVPDDPEIEVQNIVTSGDLDETLNLNAIAIGLGLEHVEYEPEQFPGLVYRLDDPAVVVLLFGSGKFVVAGSNRIEDAERAVEAIEDRLVDLGLL